MLIIIKKVILILLLMITLTEVYAESKYGLELAPHKTRETHLDHFINLYKTYCYMKSSSEIVLEGIKKSQHLIPSKEYEGLYEVNLDGLNYAVTIDPVACVVDILLEYEPGRLLLDLNVVVSAIESIDNLKLKVSKEITEIGAFDQNVKTHEARFQQKNGPANEIVLTYPLDNQDNWYMTLSYHYKSYDIIDDSLVKITIQEEAKRLNKGLPIKISKHNVVYSTVEAKFGNTIRHIFQYNNLVRSSIDPEKLKPQLIGMKNDTCEKYKNKNILNKDVYLSGMLFTEFMFVDKNGEEINSIKFTCK